jgi:hypothetical protein
MTVQLSSHAVPAAPTRKVMATPLTEPDFHQQQRERVVASLLRGARRDKPTQRRWA